MATAVLVIAMSACNEKKSKDSIIDSWNLNEQYLMEIWGVGPVTLEKIKTKLNENGAWFGMDVIRVGNHWYRIKQGSITD